MPASTQQPFRELEPAKDWAFQGHEERLRATAFTHGYHRYPAKFIPQIVEQLIKDYAPDNEQLVCDPFGGCGTTLVEAKLSGHESVGFDINPVAKLITETKVTPIDPETLAKYLDKFLEYHKNAPPVSSVRNERIGYWFHEEIAEELDKIYFAIKEIKNHKIRRFFLCAFSHNLKNSSRWLMKSIKPTLDKNKTFPNVKKSFLRHLDSMLRKNKTFYSELRERGNEEISARMYRRDSTRKLPLESGSVDLIITSPPYVTSYEYADLHQLSLLWFGGDVEQFRGWHKFSDEFTDFRSSFIGTRAKKEKKGTFDSVIGEAIVDDLSSINKPLSSDVRNYFLDMERAFGEMYRILKKNGKACVVIGNTKLRGVDILNAEVAAEQMQNTGFEKVRVIKREISSRMITPWRDSETGKFTGKDNPLKTRAYEYEYIVVMQKPKHFS